MEVTLVITIDELKHREIHEEEWRKIAKILNIYPMRLKGAWYRKLHPQLFIPHDLKTETVAYEVFNRYSKLKTYVVCCKFFVLFKIAKIILKWFHT